ncbi:uncharacterized protein FA14DRAFT_185198 [Meira miltonrushii]|uniref:Zn(2)-C6 fungal-type domain-containing protein n=1 Tax=Meira miltonrushii TaxID=1280837 RepID=A0A316V8R4_9BASI|nr:uncharacterized protein FA14DRAFT_185198 [Meira miltonrushii]PWN33418.1 hypothetical protein FA14DRAFT_185198 [Meira miltonrushii]
MEKMKEENEQKECGFEHSLESAVKDDENLAKPLQSSQTHHDSNITSHPHPVPHATAEEIANNIFLSSMADENEKKIPSQLVEGQATNQPLTANPTPPTESNSENGCTNTVNNNPSNVVSPKLQEEQLNGTYPTPSQGSERQTIDRKFTPFFPTAPAAMTSEGSVDGVSVEMGSPENGVRIDQHNVEKGAAKAEHSMTTRSKDNSIHHSEQQMQYPTLPISNNSSFDQSAHQNDTQNLHPHNGSMQQGLNAPYCQSAPPTITSFEGALNSPTHPTGPMYHNNYYNPPYTSTYGQSQPYYQQQNQHNYGQAQSYDHTFQSHADPQGQMSHSNSSSMMHSQNGGLEPPPFFGSAATSVTSYDSEVGKSYHQQAHHYYHGSVPVPSDDLRRSASSQRLGTNGYQPYTVPTQAHRGTSHMGLPGQIATSSIFMANTNNMPDLRLNPGAMHAGASYGRLPDGKIIELFPAMMRTVQACEYCRSRKAKCTGGLPCDRCAKKKIKCEYAQLDKKRKIKTTTSEYDMSSGAARMAANKTIEQAQAQLSAKIGINNDRHDDGMMGHPSYSSGGRSASGRNMRMSKSTPGLDSESQKANSRRIMSSENMIRLAVDPIMEEVDENISAQVMFAKPRFTAPILSNLSRNAHIPAPMQNREGHSPASESQSELDLGQQSSNVGPVIQSELEADQELQNEVARTTYSSFPNLNVFPPLNDSGEDAVNLNRSLYG